MVEPGPSATYGIGTTAPSTTNTTVSTRPNSSARPRTLSRRHHDVSVGSASGLIVASPDMRRQLRGAGWGIPPARPHVVRAQRNPHLHRFQPALGRYRWVHDKPAFRIRP